MPKEMGKQIMNKLYKVEELVEEVLTENKKARSDNFMLVYEVYCRIDRNLTRKPFNHVMLLHKEYGLPSFESIVRCARKLRKQNEKLRPNNEMEEIRLNATADYINYSIDGYNPTFMKFVDSQK